MQDLAKELTRQFYRWERRGRGWNVYDVPVDLEPPHAPLQLYLPDTEIIDDGERKTLLSSVADSVWSMFSQRKPKRKEEPFRQEELKPYTSGFEGTLSILSISVPKGHKVRMEEMEQLLVMLSDCQAPVSFEIRATSADICLQMVCAEQESGYVHSLLNAYFPAVTVQDRPDMPLYGFIDENKRGRAIDLGLAEEFMRPLNMLKDFGNDPYVSLFSVMDSLKGKEEAFIQILFKGTINPWSKSILDAVTDGEGNSFFMDSPEMVPLAKEKAAYPLFGVVVRIIGQDETYEQADNINDRILRALNKVSGSPYNRFIALSLQKYDPEHYVADIINRRSRRLGMLLNSRELATLAHFPSALVVSSKLHRNRRRTKAAPGNTEGHEYMLGYNDHAGVEKEVTVSLGQRLKHTHVIGATGTGKSTLLLFSVIQDMLDGNGLAVLDPHGDLIESIIPYVPEERIKDVIIIDPADAEYPVCFNILQAHSEIEKEVLSSDLVAVFRRLSTSWGDQMNSVFANAILAFLESSEGGTLADLRRFLIEKSYRDDFLKTVTDASIVYYWQKEFPILKSSSIGPILTRLDSFLRPKLIRNMVSQKKSLDFEQILDTKKILLLKLSQGLIGTENSSLLGTFIVSKIQQAALARQAKSRSERGNFYFYIDEFQNFITPSMSAILSGARKYHLGLILAHQDMQQLAKQDAELASSVVSNAGTRICFRLGDDDAKRFESSFSAFDASDFQNLGVGEAIVRIERSDGDFSLVVPRLHLVENAEEIYDAVLQASRAVYGTPQGSLETLFQSIHSETPDTQKGASIINDQIPTQNRLVLSIPEKSVLMPLTEDQIAQTKNNIVERERETRHRYLQTYIKKMAESRGYKATLEEPTPDGTGRVDLSLERNGKRIAVEIKNTTTDEWELQNIAKCLRAGYDLIIECTEDIKATERLSRKIEQAFNKSDINKILVSTPNELVNYLDIAVAKDATTETRVKGYRVLAEYNSVSPDDITKTTGSSLRMITDIIRKKQQVNE